MGVDADDVVAYLEEHLMSQNVYVVAGGVVDGTLELVYETVVPEGGVPPRQVGAIAQALRDLDDWEPQRVAATAVSPHGLVHGTWRLRGEWFRNLADGEMDEYEFSERAIDSIEAWGPRNTPDGDERPRFSWYRKRKTPE